MFYCCVVRDTLTFRQARSLADYLNICSGSSKAFTSFLFPFFICRSLTQNHHSLITALNVIRNDGHSDNDSLIFHIVQCDKYKCNKNSSNITVYFNPGVKNQVLYVVKSITSDRK